MPIYEYRCNVCGHELEVLQAISESPLQECPKCGQSELRKLVSAPVFRLKGKGWYETDFKTNNRHNLAGESNSSETKTTADKPAAEKSATGESASASGKSAGPAQASTEA